MDYLQYKVEMYLILILKDLEVLNLVINGLPSIHKVVGKIEKAIISVLNLVINGLPSIQKIKEFLVNDILKVLNLVINGLPSIPLTKTL